MDGVWGGVGVMYVVLGAFVLLFLCVYFIWPHGDCGVVGWDSHIVFFLNEFLQLVCECLFSG